jgi:hypothetical protein
MFVIAFFSAAIFAAGKIFFPHVALPLLLGALVLFFLELDRRASVGYQDDRGFHFAQRGKA